MTDHEPDPASAAGGRSHNDNSSPASEASSAPLAPGTCAPASPASPSPVIANEKAGLGDALRSVYQRTVMEDIPPEMLDLLKRLD